MPVVLRARGGQAPGCDEPNDPSLGSLWHPSASDVLRACSRCLDRHLPCTATPPTTGRREPLPRAAAVSCTGRSLWRDPLHLQPGVRLASSIHLCSSGRCTSSRVVTLK